MPQLSAWYSFLDGVPRGFGVQRTSSGSGWASSVKKSLDSVSRVQNLPSSSTIQHQKQCIVYRVIAGQLGCPSVCGGAGQTGRTHSTWLGLAQGAIEVFLGRIRIAVPVLTRSSWSCDLTPDAAPPGGESAYTWLSGSRNTGVLMD